MTESFCEACNVINGILFQETGRTKLAEEIATWGILGGETCEELKQIALNHLIN
jgi:hypothetical protein